MLALFYRGLTPRGGSRRDPWGRSAIKAARTQAILSFDRSESKRQHLTIDQAGGRISISSHAKGSYAKGSYPIPKISIGFHTLIITFPASFPWTFPGRTSY